LSCGLRFFDRLRLRWRQLVEILAGDVRLPALVNAGAFVEVALSVADFDFEPGSGAPRPVLWSAHIIAPYRCLESGGSAGISGSGVVEQARAAFFLEPKALMFATL
jgi:hypothetical protein